MCEEIKTIKITEGDQKEDVVGLLLGRKRIQDKEFFRVYIKQSTLRAIPLGEQTVITGEVLYQNWGVTGEGEYTNYRFNSVQLQPTESNIQDVKEIILGIREVIKDIINTQVNYKPIRIE